MTNTVPTATIDTTVVIHAINETRDAAVALLKLGMEGKVDLAVTTRLRLELLKSKADGDLASYMEQVPVLSSPGVFGISQFGDDVYSSYARPHTEKAIDADHIEAHLMSQRQYFVTCDKNQRNRAVRAGCTAFTPEEMVEVLRP